MSWICQEHDSAVCAWEFVKIPSNLEDHLQIYIPITFKVQGFVFVDSTEYIFLATNCRPLMTDQTKTVLDSLISNSSTILDVSHIYYCNVVSSD